MDYMQGFTLKILQGWQSGTIYIDGYAIGQSMEGGKMPTTGEKPGKGTYYCTNCGQAVTLDDDTDTLPPCPKCGGTDFR